MKQPEGQVGSGGLRLGDVEDPPQLGLPGAVGGEEGGGEQEQEQGDHAWWSMQYFG